MSISTAPPLLALLNGADAATCRKAFDWVVDAERAEEYKTQAAVERRKHQRLSARWTAVYFALVLPILVLTTLTGATGLFADDAELAGILGFSAALLTGIAALLQPQRHAARQRRLVLGYQTVWDRCEDFLADPPATPANEHRIVASLRSQLHRLVEDDVKDEEPLPDLPAAR